MAPSWAAVVGAVVLTGVGLPACLAACAPLTDARRARVQSTVARDMTVSRLGAADPRSRAAVYRADRASAGPGWRRRSTPAWALKMQALRADRQDIRDPCPHRLLPR